MLHKRLPTLVLVFMTAAVPARGEVIRIGGIQPLSGWGANEGMHVRNGAEIAVARINAAGGINGKRLELIMEDGRNNPTASLNAARKLIERDKVSVLFGAWLSSATLALIPSVMHTGTPLVVETSGSDEITYPPKKYVFRTAVPFMREAQAAGKALRSLGVGKVAFIAQNNDFGRGFVREMQKTAELLGIRIGSVFFTEPDAGDYRPQLLDIKDSDCDMIVVTHGNQRVSKILEQRAELGVTQPVFATGGSARPRTVARLNGGPPTRGSYYLAFFAADHPEAAPNPEEAVYYINEWKKRGLARDGIQEGARGYEAIMTIAAGIAEAGGSADREAVAEGLSRINRQGILGRMKFDKHHDIIPNILVLRVDGDNGEYTVPAELNTSPYLSD